MDSATSALSANLPARSAKAKIQAQETKCSAPTFNQLETVQFSQNYQN
jgi:hypothetical protein